jgi:hypothetical protein
MIQWSDSLPAHPTQFEGSISVRIGFGSDWSVLGGFCVFHFQLSLARSTPDWIDRS